MTLAKARTIAMGVPLAMLTAAYFLTGGSPMFAVGFFFGVAGGTIAAMAYIAHFFPVGGKK